MKNSGGKNSNAHILFSFLSRIQQAHKSLDKVELRRQLAKDIEESHNWSSSKVEIPYFCFADGNRVSVAALTIDHITCAIEFFLACNHPAMMVLSYYCSILLTREPDTASPSGVRGVLKG